MSLGAPEPRSPGPPPSWRPSVARVTLLAWLIAVVLLGSLAVTLARAASASDAEDEARRQASGAAVAEEDLHDAATRLADLKAQLEQAEAGHGNLSTRAKKNERRIALLKEEIARLEAAAAARDSERGSGVPPSIAPPNPPTWVCVLNPQGEVISCHSEHGD